jgi:hypothetical protein
MPAPADFSVFFTALEASGLPWCVTGSVASGIYGEPRMTVDIDFVLLVRAADIPKLRAAFPEDHFSIPSTETLHGEIARADAGMFNLIHHDGMLKADIFVAKDDPLHRWALLTRGCPRYHDHEGSVAYLSFEAPSHGFAVRCLRWKASFLSRQPRPRLRWSVRPFRAGRSPPGLGRGFLMLVRSCLLSVLCFWFEHHPASPGFGWHQMIQSASKHADLTGVSPRLRRAEHRTSNVQRPTLNENGCTFSRRRQDVTLWTSRFGR